MFHLKKPNTFCKLPCVLLRVLYEILITVRISRIRRIVEESIFCLFRGEKAMPILHYVPESPPCRMVLFMGRLLNIEYDLRFVDVTNGDNLTPEYLKVRK